MKINTRNKLLVTIFIIGFALSRIIGNKIPKNVNGLILLGIPVLTIWILVEYKHPRKKQQKITLAAFILFGVAFYEMFIVRYIKEINPNIFYQSKALFISAVLIPWFVSFILLVINKIFFYEDNNKLL